MSRGSEEKHAELLGELGQELRQSIGLGASFFRAAAARVGITVTDMQVIDVLKLAGPMTAGQLADLTGLTTGAITGMINRLEEAGLVRRERDPNDARRVIVRLVPARDEMQKIDAIFHSLREAWDEMLSHYDDKQLAFLLEFLKRGNMLSRKEIVRLREAPLDKAGIFSAPLAELSSARLVFPTGAFRLNLRAGNDKGLLYQAHFEGTVPDVKVTDGVVTIRYPRRLVGPGLSGEQRQAVVMLSRAIPWQIVIQGGGSDVTAELDGLDLASFEIKGVGSMIHLELPVPTGRVPIRISGGGSMIMVRRPAGVAVRAHLKGWGSAYVFDDQTHTGNNVWLQSSDFEPTAPYYDIEVTSSGGMVTITSG